MSGRCTAFNITEALFDCITDRKLGDGALPYRLRGVNAQEDIGIEGSITPTVPCITARGFVATSTMAARVAQS